MSFKSFIIDLETVVPPHDFIDKSFDEKNILAPKIKILYLLVSTPRSGSTWLCSEIHRKYGLVVHEYLQTAQYMPFFAQRNGLLRQDESNEYCLEFEEYVNTLVLLRPKHGILGINVHISHLFLAEKLHQIIARKYPNIKIIVHYLKRNDKYLQALSYAKASSQRTWSQVNDSNVITADKDHHMMIHIKAWRNYSLISNSAIRYKTLISQENEYLSDAKKIPFTHTFVYENLLKNASAMRNSVELIAFELGLTTKDSKIQGIKLIKTGSQADSNLIFMIKLLVKISFLLHLNLLLSSFVRKVTRHYTIPRKKRSILKIHFR